MIHLVWHHYLFKDRGIIQKLWQGNIGWDVAVSDEMQKEWKK